jgi:hypothetical protein
MQTKVMRGEWSDVGEGGARPAHHSPAMMILVTVSEAAAAAAGAAGATESPLVTSKAAKMISNCYGHARDCNCSKAFCRVIYRVTIIVSNTPPKMLRSKSPRNCTTSLPFVTPLCN